MKKENPNLTEAILETAQGMFECGVMSKKTYEKITKRHLKKEKLTPVSSLDYNEIKKIREKEHLSQASLAYYLGVTVGYVSQLERGSREPSGSILILLNLIKKKGLKSISL